MPGTKSAAEVDDGRHVDLNQGELRFGITRGHRAHGGQPGVVHQDVRGEHDGRHPVRNPRSLHGFREVDGQHVRHRVQRLGKFGQAVGSTRDKHQFITAAGEFACELLADTG